CGIAYTLTGRHIPHRENPRMGTHHGVKGVWLLRKGGAAIKADTGPHQVEMKIGAEKDAARIGKARACLRKARTEFLDYRAEAGKLLSVLRMVPVIRTSEMAYDDRDFQARRQRGITSDLCRIFDAHAKPIHACVEMESGRKGGARRTPFGKLAP